MRSKSSTSSAGVEICPFPLIWQSAFTKAGAVMILAFFLNFTPKNHSTRQNKQQGYTLHTINTHTHTHIYCTDFYTDSWGFRSNVWKVQHIIMCILTVKDSVWTASVDMDIRVHQLHNCHRCSHIAVLINPEHRLNCCRQVANIHKRTCTVFRLIEAGSLIQAGGQTSFIPIEVTSPIQAGSLIEAGGGLMANTLPDW